MLTKPLCEKCVYKHIDEGGVSGWIALLLWHLFSTWISVHLHHRPTLQGLFSCLCRVAVSYISLCAQKHSRRGSWELLWLQHEADPRGGAVQHLPLPSLVRRPLCSYLLLSGRFWMLVCRTLVADIISFLSQATSDLGTWDLIYAYHAASLQAHLSFNIHTGARSL